MKTKIKLLQRCIDHEIRRFRKESDKYQDLHKNYLSGFQKGHVVANFHSDALYRFFSGLVPKHCFDFKLPGSGNASQMTLAIQSYEQERKKYEKFLRELQGTVENLTETDLAKAQILEQNICKVLEENELGNLIRQIFACQSKLWKFRTLKGKYLSTPSSQTSEVLRSFLTTEGRTFPKGTLLEDVARDWEQQTEEKLEELIEKEKRIRPAE